MIPIELLIQKQADLYVALHPEKNIERENTIKKNGKIAGTRQLIGVGHAYDLVHDINIWLNRKHGELDF